MKLKRRGIPIVLVFVMSVMAVSSAIAPATNPISSVTHLSPTIGSSPFTGGNGIYTYLPLIIRDYPVADGWEEVGAGSASGGGISETSGALYNASIAIAPDGRPYIAWEDNSSGNIQIYVRRWNGVTWEEVAAGSASGGGISDTGGESYSPAIAIAPDGSLYIAWWENSSVDDQIYVRRWNGVSWVEVGPGSASGGGISDTGEWSTSASIAIAPSAKPYVAWRDGSTGDGQIYVRRWNGVIWEEVGPGSASGGGISDTGYAELPSIAVAPNGKPFIAWADGSSGNAQIYVRRWNGVSWVEVGPGSASGGGISDTSGYSLGPSIAIAPEGTPYISWTLHVPSHSYAQIYVRRWNGVSWEEVGAGSASGGGITNSLTESFGSAIAIDPDGRPYVTWEEGNWPDGEIYVRSWNGSSWGEVGAGSASGGGISANISHSWSASIAVAPDGTPYITWLDGIPTIAEIYVRRWIGGH